MTLTKNFQSYIREFDIPTSKRLPIDEIREEDAVYPGEKIFDLFFEGSRFMRYKDYRGPENFEGLTPRNFGHWNYIFEKCLADLTEKGSGSTPRGGGDRSYLERWWDALKKVIRLYK